VLENILPPSARKTVYATYAVLGVVIGCIQVAYASSSAGQPMWLNVVLAVFGFLGTAIGATAASNTHTHGGTGQ
jgi:hypothetical protein